jgi:hypothetical protein
MKAQSFKNHGRYVFMFHIVTYAAIFAVIVGSVINLVNSSKENLYSASLLVLVSLILASLAWFGRRFALKAQDRAIRAEGGRSSHYALPTMKSLPACVNRRSVAI